MPAAAKRHWPVRHNRLDTSDHEGKPLVACLAVRFVWCKAFSRGIYTSVHDDRLGGYVYLDSCRRMKFGASGVVNCSAYY